MIYAVGALFLLIAMGIYKKSGAFFKSLLTSVIGGVGALCAVNAVSYFLPVGIGVNPFTIAFSSAFSVPGVIFLLVSEALLF